MASPLLIVCALFISAVCVPTLSMAEEGGYIYSSATYYKTPDGLGNTKGACGYGDYGRNINNGKVTGVSLGLYKNGIGCGACYQVRCEIPGHCSDDGVKVVVTDYGEGDHTGFIFSKYAFKGLSLPGKEGQLFGHGVVDVVYKRVPCNYGHNLVIKVEEHSRSPHYLAILPLYQSGTYDIVGVKLFEKDSTYFKELRKVYGAVWDFQYPPLGPLTLKLELKYGDGKLDEVAVHIPSDWKPGQEYDTGYAN